MKKQLLKVTAILSVATFMTAQNVSAQDDAAAIVKAGAGTVNDFANAYMSPLMKGFGLGLADGWNNNTARTLGTGGFDLRLNVGMCMVPTKDQSYNPSEVFKSNSNMTWVNNGVPSEAPSMFGVKEQPTGTMDGYGKVTITKPGGGTLDTSIRVLQMQLPQGSGVPYSVTLPSVQLSVGIYKNTEVMIRFIPQVTAGTLKVGTWGIGAKHSIKQWIPAIKDQKRWDWSALIAYSQFSSEFAFGTDNSLKADPSAYNPDPTIDYTNQKITMNGKGFTLGTLVSAKLLFFTPYLGLNYSYSSMNLKFEGNYPVPVPDEKYQPVSTLPNYHPYSTKISNLPDPINIDGTVSSLRLNMGARIKLAVLVIGGEFSLGAYNTATLSVGLNLQSIVPFKL